MSSAVRLMRSSTSWRTLGSKVRIVPAILTSSEMTFERTPPSILPIVITVGACVRSSWRLTMVCSPSTICEADHDRIDAAPGLRAVGRMAVDDDVQVVDAGHDAAGAIRDLAGLLLVADVQREDGRQASDPCRGRPP